MKKRYQYPVKGMPEVSKPNWDERYCFLPRTTCPFCGGNNIVYGAYLQSVDGKTDGEIRVRYLCATCGHSDGVKRVEFIPAPANNLAKIEREKRLDVLGRNGTWEDVIADAMAREMI